jgi:hypothetical protein
MHRTDAGANVLQLPLEVALDLPGHGHHALPGSLPEVLDGRPLIPGQPFDGGAVRPGQPGHGLALPSAELADERPQPLDLVARARPVVLGPGGQGSEDLFDALEPESQGLESLFGVGEERPADLSRVSWARSGLGRGGANGLGHGLPDALEALVEPFLDGPLVGGQDLLDPNGTGPLTGGGLGDGDGVGEARPGRAPPRRLGDRRGWWF